MGSSLEIMQGFTVGQIAAILNKVSSGDLEKLEALLRDELEVELVKRILKLVDKNGRCIPVKSLTAAVCDASKDFHLVQPKLKYTERFDRFQEVFSLVNPTMSSAIFEARSEGLISLIRTNKGLANLLNGVYLPIILPKLENFTDYGETLEEVFLPAIELGYKKEFPNRSFYNYRAGDLAGKVTIVSGTRHEKLIERMAQAFVVAIYFPNPLQGFSVFASRGQIAVLPESLILSGGFDALSAMAMYPDVLARDWHTPGYDLSALSWQSPARSLYLGADVGELHFVSRGSLGGAFDHGHCSSGLLFLGSA